MSSLSDFARGGAVGAGTGSTSDSPPGSPREASSSLLPVILPSGASGITGGEISALGIPSLASSGPRGDPMATPRQLDGYMHGVETDHGSVDTGDWHDTLETTTGSMGGESSSNVVRVFVVEGGAGKDMCCGQVGANGSRFCTKNPSDCGYKTHRDKKAKVKPGYVYVGSGKNETAWLSWCTPVEVFGGKASQLNALNLTGSQFCRFGETLHGLYVGGKVDMASVEWDAVLKEVTLPLDFGGTPRKVQFSKTTGAFESTGLSNWMNFDTPGSEPGSEGADGSLDRSSEDEYKLMEKVTNLTINAEFLKTAFEDLASTQGKHSTEFGDLFKTLGSQIHDVSVRLGENIGFVGSTQDTAWNGITLLHETLETARKQQSYLIDLEVRKRVDSAIQDKIQLLSSRHQADTKVLIDEAMGRGKQDREANDRLIARQIKLLQDKDAHREADNDRIWADIQDLKTDVKNLQDQIKSLPAGFSADWKLVFEFFIRNTKVSNPPVVGGALEDTVDKNSKDISKLIADVGSGANVSASSSAPSLSSMFTPNATGTMSSNGPLATLSAQVLNLQERLASKAVIIDDTTFSTLKGTTQWALANLPSSPEHALVCVDVVSLLHSIGREYATTAETRESIYQNKRAGVSTMALTVSSSFQTVLPQIMGKCSRSTTEDSGLMLPCASKYSEWADSTEGMSTGIKPQIMDGLITQRSVYQEAIRELGHSHPVGAAMANKLLQRSYDFAIKMLGMIDTMWTEYSSRSGEIQGHEAWIVISGVVRQLFRELRVVRRPGAAAIPGSSSSIGSTWWHVLQTHRIMDEFDAVDIRRHHSILPVFTSHLDRYRVTKTTHAGLVTQVKKIDTLLTAVSAKVERINGTRGNAAGRGGRGGGGRGGGDDGGGSRRLLRLLIGRRRL